MDEVHVRSDTVKPPTITVENSRNLQRKMSSTDSPPMQADDEENGATIVNPRSLKRRLQGEKASESPDLDAESVKHPRSADTDISKTLIKRRFFEASKKLRSEQLVHARKVEDAEKRKQNLEQLSKAIRQNNNRRASLGRKGTPSTTARAAQPSKKSLLRVNRDFKSEAKPKQNSIAISEIFRKPAASEKKPKPVVSAPKPEDLPIQTADNKKYTPEELKAYMELKKVKFAKQKRQERKQNEEMRRHRNDQIKQAEEFHKKGAVAFRRMVERKKKRSRASSISETVEPKTEIDDIRLKLNLQEMSDFLPQKVLVTDEESESGSGLAPDDDTELSSHSTHEENRRSGEQAKFAERIRRMKESAGRLVLRVTKYAQEKKTELHARPDLQPNLVVAKENIHNPETLENSATNKITTTVQPATPDTEAVVPVAINTLSRTVDADIGATEAFDRKLIKFPELSRLDDNPFLKFECCSVQSEGQSEPGSINSTATKLENQETEKERSMKMDWNIFGRPAPQYRPNPLSIVNIFAARYLEKKEEIILDGEHDNAFLIPKPPVESRLTIGVFARSPKLRSLSAPTHPGSPAALDTREPTVADHQNEMPAGPITGEHIESPKPDDRSTDASLQDDRFSEPDSTPTEDGPHDNGSADEQGPSEMSFSVSYSSDHSEGLEEEGIQKPRLSPRSLALEARAELCHFEEMNKASVELCELEYSYGAQSLREATTQAQQELIRFTNDASAVKAQLALREACSQEIQKVGHTHIQHLEALTSTVLKSVSRFNTALPDPEQSEIPKTENNAVIETVRLDGDAAELLDRIHSINSDITSKDIPLVDGKEALGEGAAPIHKAREFAFKQEETPVAKADESSKDCFVGMDVRNGNESDSTDLDSPRAENLHRDHSTVNHRFDDAISASSFKSSLHGQEEFSSEKDVRDFSEDEFVDSKFAVPSRLQKSQADAFSIVAESSDFASADDSDQYSASGDKRSLLAPSSTDVEYGHSDCLVSVAESAAIAESAEVLSDCVSGATGRSELSEFVSSNPELQSATEVENSDDAVISRTVTAKDQVDSNNFLQLEMKHDKISERSSILSEIEGFSEDNLPSGSIAESQQAEIQQAEISDTNLSSASLKGSTDVADNQLEYIPRDAESDHMLSSYISRGTSYASSEHENDNIDFDAQSYEGRNGPGVPSSINSGSYAESSKEDSALKVAGSIDSDSGNRLSLSIPDGTAGSRATEIHSLINDSEPNGNFEADSPATAPSSTESDKEASLHFDQADAKENDSEIADYSSFAENDSLNYGDSVQDIINNDQLTNRYNNRTDPGCSLDSESRTNKEHKDCEVPLAQVCSDDIRSFKSDYSESGNASEGYELDTKYEIRNDSEIPKSDAALTIDECSKEDSELQLLSASGPKSGSDIVLSISDRAVHSDVELAHCISSNPEFCCSENSLSQEPITACSVAASPLVSPKTSSTLNQANAEDNDSETGYGSSFSENESLDYKDSALHIANVDKASPCHNSESEPALFLQSESHGDAQLSFEDLPASHSDDYEKTENNREGYGLYTRQEISYVSEAPNPVISTTIAEYSRDVSEHQLSCAGDFSSIDSVILPIPDVTVHSETPLTHCSSNKSEFMCSGKGLSQEPTVGAAVPPLAPLSAQTSLQLDQAETKYNHFELQHQTSFTKNDSLSTRDSHLSIISGEEVGNVDNIKSESQWQSSHESKSEITTEIEDSEKVEPISRSDVADYITQAIFCDLVAELKYREPKASEHSTDAPSSYLVANPQNCKLQASPPDSGPVEQITDAILSDLVSELHFCEQYAPESEQNQAKESTCAISSYLVADVEDCEMKPPPDSDPVEEVTEAILSDLILELQYREPKGAQTERKQTNDNTNAISNYLAGEPEDCKLQITRPVEEATEPITRHLDSYHQPKAPQAMLNQANDSDIVSYLIAEPQHSQLDSSSLESDPVEEVTDAILCDLVAELKFRDPNVSQSELEQASSDTMANSSYLVAEPEDRTLRASRQGSDATEAAKDAISSSLIAELRDAESDTTQPHSNRAEEITNAILNDLVGELQDSVGKSLVHEPEFTVFEPHDPECAKLYIAQVLRNQRFIDWANPMLSEDTLNAVERQLEQQSSESSSFRRFIFDMLQSVILSLRRFGGERPPEAWHRMKPRKLRDHFWRQPSDDEIIKEVLLRIYPDPSTTYDNVDEIVNAQVQKEEWYYDDHIAEVQFEIADLIFTEILQDSIQAMV